MSQESPSSTNVFVGVVPMSLVVSLPFKDALFCEQLPILVMPDNQMNDPQISLCHGLDPGDLQSNFSEGSCPFNWGVERELPFGLTLHMYQTSLLRKYFDLSALEIGSHGLDYSWFPVGDCAGREYFGQEDS